MSGLVEFWNYRVCSYLCCPQIGDSCSEKLKTDWGGPVHLIKVRVGNKLIYENIDLRILGLKNGS